ncbi:hypothetical protein D3C71_1717650 [compost metagenome]
MVLAVGMSAKQPFFHQIDRNIGVRHRTVDGVFHLVNQPSDRQLVGEAHPVHHHRGEVADGVKELGVVTAGGGSPHQQIRRTAQQAQRRSDTGVDHVEQ